MKVTGIKAQIKSPGRYAIALDGNYAFSLSDTTLLNQKLSVGLELSAEQVKRLRKVSVEDKAYGQLLGYITLRARSEWELRRYLQRKGAPPALMSRLLNRLSDEGFVNDAAFAEAWVRNRRLLRPTSKRKLQQELRAKGVHDEVIQRVLSSEVTDERTALKELVARKRSRYSDPLKLMQYLVRQGFTYDDVKTVVARLVEDEPTL